MLQTYTYPWRTTYKLMGMWVTGADTNYWAGSAASVSSFHLITAAHCIYSHDPNGDGNDADADWADRLWVWPAQTDVVNPAAIPDFPYGISLAVYLRSYTAWTQNENSDWDMGYITMDRRLGDRTGWMGAEAGVSASSLNFNGYPTQTPYVPANSLGQYPGYDADNVTSYTTNLINMCAYTYGGHSGGPVWRLTGTSRYIQGVNSRSNLHGVAIANRLSSARFDDLFEEIIPEDQSQRPPTARPELIEYVLNTTSKDLLDTSTRQGGEFDIVYNVFNVGWVASGTITVDFYASTNTSINTSDYLLGTRTLTLNPYTYTVPTTALTVPCSVPTGLYYIGYRFRCATAEYGGSGPYFWQPWRRFNNTVVITNERLTVNSGLPGVPSLTSPASLATCQPTTVPFRWAATTNATSYNLQVGTTCGAGTTYTTSSTNYSVSGLTAGVTYFWRVRAVSSCGQGSWSSCRQFTTAPPLPAPPSVVQPVSGASCVATGGILDWTDVAGANLYEVQLSTSCGSGPIQQASSSQYSYTGLAPGTTFYWRLRARNTCDNWGAWSSCANFTTDPIVLSSPVLEAPPDGDESVPLNGELEWSNVTDAVRYQVQIGPSCGSGTVAQVNESRYEYTALDPGSEYFWHVRAGSPCGNWGPWSGCRHFTAVSLTTVEAPKIDRYDLIGNAPNPFNPMTQINFAVPAPGFVELGVYDLGGRRVRSLLREHVLTGFHSVTWDGRNEEGLPVESGIYISRLAAPGYRGTIRMVLLR